MVLLTIYISVAIGVSFICSVLEAVLLSISPGYIGTLRQQNHPAAAKLAALKDNIDRPLASILTLNTVAHTVGAATAGAQATVVDEGRGERFKKNEEKRRSQKWLLWGSE